LWTLSKAHLVKLAIPKGLLFEAALFLYHVLSRQSHGRHGARRVGHFVGLSSSLGKFEGMPRGIAHEFAVRYVTDIAPPKGELHNALALLGEECPARAPSFVAPNNHTLETTDRLLRSAFPAIALIRSGL